MRKKVFFAKTDSACRCRISAGRKLSAGPGGEGEGQRQEEPEKEQEKGGERCCFCDLSGIGQEQLEGIGIQRTSRHP